MKRLSLSIFTLFISFACSNDDDPSVDPQPVPIDPEFADFSKIKSDDWRSKIGQEITVEGYLIPVSESSFKIVNDSSYAMANTILQDENYILVQVDPNAEEYNVVLGSLREASGAKVKAVGRLAEYQANDSQGESIIQTSQLLGNKSLATISLKKTIEDLKGPRYSMSTKFLGDIVPLTILKPFPENRTKFALLYSGGIDAMQAYGHYYNNIRIMYDLLLKQGYVRENIVVVYKAGVPESIMVTTRVPYIKTYAEIPVNQPATPDGLDNAIAYLNDRMQGQNAELFLMLTNHGGGYHAMERRNYAGAIDSNGDEPTSDSYRLDEVSTFYNTNRFITDDEFASKINSLPFVSLKALFLQCFSGGFIHDFKGRNRVLMSATSETEFSWGGGSYDMDVFLMNFISPIYLNSVPGISGLIDLNRDGKLSMYEIFTAARINQQVDNRDRPQYFSSPQYDDDGDGVPNEPSATGFGAQLTL